MNIHSAGKNRIIVELSKKDMLDLDITYEEMDYSKIETRRVIWTILEKVRDSTGRDVDPTGNLLIEVTADSQGGCVLCFTVGEKKRTFDYRQPLRLTKTTDSMIYEFENENDLLDMIYTVGRNNFENANKIFKNKNRFRIVLSKLPCSRDKKIIEEYGTYVGRDELSLAYTAEYWDFAGRI